MSKRSSGVAFEKRCKEWLEEHFPGVVVHHQKMNHVAIGPGKWICQENDILGCIDLLAIHFDQKPLFIQASLDEHITKRLKKMAEVPWNLNHAEVQLWIRRPDFSIAIKKLHYDVAAKDYYLMDHAKIKGGKYERCG